jgi:DNA-binding CsgD family transcriptional regulator
MGFSRIVPLAAAPINCHHPHRFDAGVVEFHNGFPMSDSHRKIGEWAARFRKAPLAARVVAGLQRQRGEIWRRTFDLLQRESPEYRSSVDEEFTKESRSHCGELLGAIIAVAVGRAERTEADPFGFVRVHARWRARQQVPLIASLHAYRLAHKTYWEISREAVRRHADPAEVLDSLTMLSDFWIEFFDHVGAVLAEAHAVEEGMSGAQGTRSYVSLIDDLLRGAEPRGREARRLRTLCGIHPGMPLAVAVARSSGANGHPADLEVKLRSITRLFQQVLPPTGFGRLVDLRHEEVIAIVSSESGPARGLVRELRRHGFSRKAAGASIGVSLDTADVPRLPRALEEARTALEFTAPAQPLLHFAEIDLGELLVRRADPAALRLIPDGLHGLSGDGVRTLRAFADSSFNVKQTARRLGVHPNTVYFRLNRISQLTGIDTRTFAGASLLLTGLRLREVHTGS